MTQQAASASNRALLAVGAAFLAAHAIGLATGPREEVPACAMCVEYRVDPNTASRDDLMLLPGVGPALADRIIAQRNASSSRPAFGCAEDLDDVDRIGPAMVERLRPHLTFPTPRAGQSN